MDYWGAAKGVSTAKGLWDEGVHAFPDLATGSGLNLKPWADKQADTKKIFAGKRWGPFGLEAAIADLGKHGMGFDISGDFATALGKEGGPGRAVESGSFNILAPSVSGTYTKDLGPLSLTAKLGIAAALSQGNTVSDYDFDLPSGREKGVVFSQQNHLSPSPVFGLGAAYKMGKWKARVEAERYNNVRVAKSPYPWYADKGKVPVDALWFGLEREF